MSATASSDVELWQTVQPHHRDDVTAMPGPIVEAIREHSGGVDFGDDGLPTGDRTWQDIQLPELILPGLGDDPDAEPTTAQDDCGDPLPHACVCCGHVIDVGRTCSQSTCARCASAWCRERASAWTARLMQAKAYRYGATGRDQHYHHLVVSPPDDFTSPTPRKDGEAIVRAIMDELGLEGVAPFHPFRGAEETAFEGEPLHQSEKPGDLNEWKNRVLQGPDGPSFAELRDSELRWSPHWHLVGVGGFVRGGQLTKAVEDATGWVIHRITPDDETYSIRDEEQLARVLSYCYSHAGIRRTDSGRRRVAQTYHKDWMSTDRFEVSDDVEQRADQIVREEAWKVLGIPSATMTCLEIEDVHDDYDHEEHDVPEPDGDGADASSTTSSEPVPDVDRCRGRLRSIDDYDHDHDELWWARKLNDDDWRDDAEHEADVARALAEWRKAHADDPPD